MQDKGTSDSLVALREVSVQGLAWGGPAGLHATKLQGGAEVRLVSRMKKATSGTILPTRGQGVCAIGVEDVRDAPS
jgi:hypothetical protein